MIAAALCDENQLRYDLNTCAKKIYRYNLKMNLLYTLLQKNGVVDPKGEMYKLPAMYVGQYAEKDASITLQLWQVFKIEK